ncbi:MAG: YfhO family protein [Candidatus Obscuribacterales bacterium]|nr:YfhO family protein [Candidatus Obscuribacterales bacterium]
MDSSQINQSESDGATDQQRSSLQSQQDSRSIKFWYLVVPVLAIVIMFYRTMLAGEPISRLNLIEQLDLVYANTLDQLKGVFLTVPEDPSVCFQSYPKSWFLQTCIESAKLPIWNNLTGFGQPILADLANCLFHPVNLILGVKNQATYNAGLVLKIILPSVFAFWYFLRQGSSSWAAATASIGFALYSRSLRVAELANTSMAPAIFIAFDLLRGSFHMKKILLAVTLIVLGFYSMHPESFFITVLAGMYIWTFDAIKNSNKKNPLQAAKQLSLTGILSICLCSPLLFSFVEFLQLAHSYKFNDTFGEYIPLNQFLLYLSSPKIPHNLFPGTVILLAIPAGLWFGKKEHLVLFSLLLLTLLFETRPAPLDRILTTPPISYVLPEYSISIILLLLCTFASIGLTQLGQASKAENTNLPDKAVAKKTLEKWQPLILLLFGAALCFLPNIFSLFRATDLPVGLTAKANITHAILTLVPALLLCLNSLYRSKLATNSLIVLAFLLFPILNAASLWTPVHLELPYTSTVQIPAQGRSEFIEKLKGNHQQRFTACGDRLLLPNTSLLYGLSDLRTGTPLNIASYLEFMKAAGATLGYCNEIQIPYELNKLYDAASVKLIASDLPIRSLQPKRIEAVNNSSKAKVIATDGGRFIPGLRLLPGTAVYDPQAGELKVESSFVMHIAIPNRYQFQYVLTDDNGKELWKSKFKFVEPRQAHLQDRWTTTNYLPLPNFDAKRLRLNVVMIDGWSSQKILPEGFASQQADATLCAFETQQVDRVQTSDGRFRLLHETADHIRIYENTQALPRAYCLGRIKTSPSNEDTLRLLNSKDFDPSSEAIISGSSANDLAKYSGAAAAPPAPAEATLVEEFPDNTVVQTDTKSSRVLVLTNIFYPGWNVYVDGKKRELLRANHLFQAVEIESGKHKVEFKYEPLPLTIAWALVAMALLFGASVLAKDALVELKRPTRAS